MDRIELYRKIIKDLLEEYAQYPPANGDIEVEAILDEVRDRYLLLGQGWEGHRRVHGCSVHLDIKDGKVWLQHDSTDAEIARQLVERGIPQQDIVLGFQPERIRRLSGFGVG